MTGWRTFNGEKYRNQGTSKYKNNAEERAKHHRKQGRKARVVKFEGGWAVYTRG